MPVQPEDQQPNRPTGRRTRNQRRSYSAANSNNGRDTTPSPDDFYNQLSGQARDAEVRANNSGLASPGIGVGATDSPTGNLASPSYATPIPFSDSLSDITIGDPVSPTTIRHPTHPNGLEALANVQHGLIYPTFNVQENLANDLLTQSSALQRTTKQQADEIVQGIQEQRQTVRIIKENIGLNTDIVNAGIAQNKFLGTVTDYGTSRTNLATKLTTYERAGINHAIAQTGLLKDEEKLYQTQNDLVGTQSQTPLLKEKLQHQNSLLRSQVQDLRGKILDATVEPVL